MDELNKEHVLETEYLPHDVGQVEEDKTFNIDNQNDSDILANILSQTDKCNQNLRYISNVLNFMKDLKKEKNKRAEITDDSVLMCMATDVTCVIKNKRIW